MFGGISWEISNLLQLVQLDLSGNKLSGELPDEFSELEWLERIVLNENDFTGSIPNAFSDMASLRYLSLHQKTNTQGGFTGELPDFKGSVNLRYLNVASNSLSSFLPETFMENSVYTDDDIYIELSHNNIRGSIPLSWQKFGYMNINLSDNLISDIPDNICSMEDWQFGAVGMMETCDSILCPPNSFNAIGRATSDNECVSCPTIEQIFGATTCGSLGADEVFWILEIFYASTGGDDWDGVEGWLNSPDPCDGTWDGIFCDNDNIDIIKIDLSGSGLTGTPDPIIFNIPNLEELNFENNDIDFDFTGIASAKDLTILHLSETRVSSLGGIGEATSLTELHITSSYLSGQIPDELYELTNLRGLFLNYNQLGGRISPKIGRLAFLEELFLLNNDLTGPIPAAIGNLEKMKYISLSQNYFVGAIPESINNMKNLEVLAIQAEGTHVDDDDRRKLQIQRRKTQAYSGLTGTLPAFDGFTKLRELYLGFNSIGGEIPYNFLAGIEDKTNKITIELETNNLSGVVPASLTQFDQLDLFIGGNKFDSIAQGLCGMDNWFGNEVNTFDCDVILCPKGTFSLWGRRDSQNSCEQCAEGFTTTHMGSYECVSAYEQALENERDVLKLMYENLDGIGWYAQDNWNDNSENFCDWHGITCTSGRIESIDLAENGLKGTLPDSVFDLPNLIKLNLAGNEIKINFDYIGSSSLEYLNLDSTGLTNLRGIESASSLTMIHASDNGFATFPPELLSLSGLQVLYLSDNKFEGAIPNLSSHSELTFFACKRCGFTGSIPSWMGQLKSLRYLSLASNKLTGDISFLGQLEALTHLDISDQAPRGGGLTGPIPSFSDLQNISEVYLHKNKLSGTIPDDFLANTSSKSVTVDLRKNAISGSIPKTFKNLDFDEFMLLLAGNKIDEIPKEICNLQGWNLGDLADAGCDGLLCEKGFYNPIGRESDGYECMACPETDDIDTQSYFGSTTCGTSVEIESLEKIFNSLGGPDWNSNYGWMENDIYCEWYGVECDSDSDIIGLDLSSNGLVGKLPKETYDLIDLMYLNLKENEVSIDFSGIENLSSLGGLNLSGIGLTSISGIGAALSVTELHLTDNKLTSIPDELYNLSNLEILRMNYNSIEGKLSPKIKQLSVIKEIFMFRNKLSGSLPTEIADLADIEILALGKFESTKEQIINDAQVCFLTHDTTYCRREPFLWRTSRKDQRSSTSKGACTSAL